MKIKLFIVILFVLALSAGCAAEKKQVVVDSCPLPTGYKMGPAIDLAERTLELCPQKLDRVFLSLLDIAKHSPNEENGAMIQGMIKRLIRQNLVSEKYSRELYQKYFSRTFVTLPDVKVYNLSSEIDFIKKELRKELRFKHIGFVECCGDKEGYKKVEGEYARIINFLEDLVLNEDYVKSRGE